MIKAYIAISKADGGIMSGARGHTVFDNPETLRKSIGADYWKQRLAREKGCKVKDLYDVYEFELNIEQGVKL
jgi:hypothetical protein